MLDPVTGTIAAAGLTGLANLFGGERANSANAKQAQLNRDFQERMSNTSYQRATADMRAAGLNPALAYQQGGSSTPGGATAAPQQNTLGTAVSSAVDKAAQIAQIAATGAQVEKTEKETQMLDLEQRMRETLSGAELAARMNEIEGRGAMAGMRKDQTWLALLKQKMQADLKATQTSAAEGASRTQLLNLQQPSAANAARMANTWWGKYVSPFLNDAKTASQLIRPR